MDYSVLLLPFILVSSISLGYYFKLKKFKNSYNESASKSPNHLISNRTKYLEVNVFRYRPMFLKMGLAVSLGFVLMAFSWTTSPQSEYYAPIEFGDMITEVEPPRTPPEKKKLPPPPQPIIEEVPNEEPVEEPKLESLEIEVDDEIDPIIPEPVEEPSEVVVPPPLPPEEDEAPKEIFKVVEEMPRFPGCESGSKEERRVCSDKKLLQYLAKNLKYPAIARENGVEGRLYVQFVVNQDGSIQDTEILRDIGAGCGEAALKVVKDMNNLPQKWTPGRQRGIAVRVMYTLPVTFTLNK